MKDSSKVQLLTNSILKENASNIFLVLLDWKYTSYPDNLCNQHVVVYIRLVYNVCVTVQHHTAEIANSSDKR
jgi:hypothetical protein